jgi:hypothetical protein
MKLSDEPFSRDAKMTAAQVLHLATVNQPSANLS